MELAGHTTLLFGSYLTNRIRGGTKTLNILMATKLWLSIIEIIEITIIGEETMQNSKNTLAKRALAVGFRILQNSLTTGHCSSELRL